MITRRRTVAAIAALTLTTGLVVAGCGSSSSSNSDTSGGSAAGGDVGELTVGDLVGLTGGLAPYGKPNAKAAELGVGVVNDAAGESGVDINMKMVTEDTKTDPQAAQEAATKLIETDGANVLIGPMASSEVIPTAQNVSIDAGVPLTSPSSTDPSISTLEDNGLVFRTAPSDANQGKLLAKVIAEQIGATATVNTGNRNDAYGNSLIQEFTKAWEAGGGTVGQSVAYDPKATSLQSEADKLASGNPDAWVIIDFTADFPKMGNALVRTGKWDPAKTWTADGLKDPGLAAQKKIAEGMQGTVPTSIGAPAAEAFDALWQAKAGMERQTYDAQAFDAAILYALAAVRAGSTDGTAIASKLQEVSSPPGKQYTYEQLADALKAVKAGEDIDYEGASGPIDLDANGDPQAANYGTWKYQNGKLVESSKVFPLAAAGDSGTGTTTN